jgi:hypothetical protein
MDQASAPTKLFNGLLTTTPGAKYTSPDADTKAMIVSIILHNTGATPRTVTLWLVPTGQSQAATYEFFKQEISAYGTEVFKEQLYMSGEDSIFASQDTGTDVSIFINGVEVTPVP